jgi:hypothetical protein
MKTKKINFKELSQILESENGRISGGFQLIRPLDNLAIIGGDEANNCNGGNCVTGCGSPNKVPGCGITTNKSPCSP